MPNFGERVDANALKGGWDPSAAASDFSQTHSNVPRQGRTVQGQLSNGARIAKFYHMRKVHMHGQATVSSKA